MDLGLAVGLLALAGVSDAAAKQPDLPPRPSRLFRIVKNLDPQLADFMSNAAKGLPPADREISDPAEHQSISTFLEQYQAERVARAHHWAFGRYIAELRIPTRARAQVWPSEPPEGHRSLKASPKAIRRWVHRVVRLA